MNPAIRNPAFKTLKPQTPTELRFPNTICHNSSSYIQSNGSFSGSFQY